MLINIHILKLTNNHKSIPVMFNIYMNNSMQNGIFVDSFDTQKEAENFVREMNEAVGTQEEQVEYLQEQGIKFPLSKITVYYISD